MERELKFILSLDMAKKWYKSNDTALKMLALSVYTENELTTITMDDILNSISDEAYHSVNNKVNAYLNISIVAKYFNKNWNKTNGDVGYYWSKNDDNTWSIKMHQSVTYPGIIYYKDKSTATIAFDIVKEFYEIINKH